jgi:hypothetical protein
MGSQQLQILGIGMPLLHNFQELGAYGSSGADNGYGQVFHHWRSIGISVCPLCGWASC